MIAHARRIEPSQVIMPSCISGLEGISYYTTTSTISLLVVLVIVGISVQTMLKKHREQLSWSEVSSTETAGRAIKDIFVCVLLVHPVLCGKAMEFFRCQKIEGEWYMMADYSLRCYDSSWYGFLPVALVILFGFAIGVPVAIFAILYPRRHNLFDPDSRRAYPHPLDVLYRPYRPEAWYFESVSMGFKVPLWSALVYFKGEALQVQQLTVGLLVNLAMFGVVARVQPMGSRDSRFLNLLVTMGSLLLTLLALGGLAMSYAEVVVELKKLEDEGNEQQHQAIIEQVQVLIEVLTFGFMVCVALYCTTRVFRKVEHSARRSVQQNGRYRFVAVAYVAAVDRLCLWPRSKQDAATASDLNECEMMSTWNHNPMRAGVTPSQEAPVTPTLSSAKA